MTITYRQAVPEDAGLLVSIYNTSFYGDYLRYGACPGYGRTEEAMEASVRKYPKFLILCDGEPVGYVSCQEQAARLYEIGCLCVVPAFQGRGIGTQAVRFVEERYADWARLTLVTPADKRENVRFYTEKCGFHVAGTEKNGDVALVRFVLER